MTDEEVERRYHEMRLEKLNKKITELPTPRCTGTQRVTKNCLNCGGTGKVVASIGGWYIIYQYQDCTESSDIMSKEEAVKRYRDNKDKSVMLMLIGPDGMVYTI